MLISTAMQRGDAPDPFEAILLGVMPPLECRRYASRLAGMSNESLCDLRIKKLHAEFPSLGQDVRAYPAFATMLEDKSVLPRIRPWQTVYRQEVHMSLWGAIMNLFDRGLSKDAIAHELAAVGL